MRGSALQDGDQLCYPVKGGGGPAVLPSEGVDLEQLIAGCADIGILSCVLFKANACIVVLCQLR